MTLGIMTLTIMTPTIMTLSKIIFSKSTLNIVRVTIIVLMSLAECRKSVVILSVILLGGAAP
jgi:hypothetical protein